MKNNTFAKTNKLVVAVIISLVIFGFIASLVTREYIKDNKRLVEEVEYYDSLNNYNKIYYSNSLSSLKNENKELYDSLKEYKDKIDYIVQFHHEKEYNTGKISQKSRIIDSMVYDTIPIEIPRIAKTYEYTSEPNDTFSYKLNINSFTEPNWYSLNAKVKNKFTIVNKEEDGANHITIGSNNGGIISDATVFKSKGKNNLLKKFSVGPSVTTGYDVINKQWGIMVGASVTFNLK